MKILKKKIEKTRNKQEKIGQKRAGTAKMILKRITFEIQMIQIKKERKSFKKT